ncbi:MAG: acylphosphatase [Dehalococcoidia bacterium]
MEQRRRFIVRGTVQGVGFRDYVMKRGRLLGLTGWVRNLPDGRTVEAVAQGDGPSLEAFAEDFMRGPRGARVTEFQAQPEPADAKLNGPFAIKK